jgi:hypothetical protein
LRQILYLLLFLKNLYLKILFPKILYLLLFPKNLYPKILCQQNYFG